MTDRPCPVSITDIFQAEFKPFSHDDWFAFASVEGDGYMAYITIDDTTYQVVLDAGTDSQVQVHHIDGETGTYEAWLIAIATTIQIL